MPTCSKCKNDLPIHEFYLRGKSQRRQSYCKKCFNSYKMLSWNQNKINAIKHLGGKCIECGFTGHPALFDFHHKDPTTKDCDWTILRKKSWTKIIAELSKCDLLCCMCHRLKHTINEQWPSMD